MKKKEPKIELTKRTINKKDIDDNDYCYRCNIDLDQCAECIGTNDTIHYYLKKQEGVDDDILCIECGDKMLKNKEAVLLEKPANKKIKEEQNKLNFVSAIDIHIEIKREDMFKDSAIGIYELIEKFLKIEGCKIVYSTKITKG